MIEKQDSISYSCVYAEWNERRRLEVLPDLCAGLQPERARAPLDC